MNLIEKMHKGHCHLCNTDNSIFLNTSTGKKIPVSVLYNNKELINRTVFVSAECSKCHHIFELDWSDRDDIPSPLIPYSLKKFNF